MGKEGERAARGSGAYDAGPLVTAVGTLLDSLTAGEPATPDRDRELMPAVDEVWDVDRALERLEIELVERLRANEERFTLLVDSVEDYAIFMLDPKGVVTSWNSGAQRIKGYRPSEILGRHFSIFYTPEDLARRKPARALASAERRGRWTEEGWRLRKDGTRFLANVTITALRDAKGRLRGFAKVTRDITRMRRLQDRVLQAERRETARYQQVADQLKALEELKSQFLNLASHELRTPVSLIRGYLSLFEDGDLGDLNADGRTALMVLREQTAHLHSLIGQMLEAASMQDGSLDLVRTTVDLRDEASLAIATTREVAGTGREITVEMPADPIRVSVDRDRLAQILGHLLDNAIKYSPAGSGIRCVLERSSRWARVSISDQGLGFTRAQRSQLFRPFGRHVDGATAAIQGAGLGLYLARSLARMHGGDIQLVSSRTAGSTFRLTLPLAGQQPAGRTSNHRPRG